MENLGYFKTKKIKLINVMINHIFMHKHHANLL